MSQATRAYLVSLIGVLLAVVAFSPSAQSQNCSVVVIGDNSGSRKGGFDEPPPFDEDWPNTLLQGPLPGPAFINTTDYVTDVHGVGTRVGSIFFGYAGMNRNSGGELDYPGIGGSGGGGDSLMPDDIKTFDGESFELNSELPPASGALKDFWSVDLSTGQINLTLPTGMGFGTAGSHDSQLNVQISSAIDRVGPLGRFATFGIEDFLVVDVVIPMEEACGNPNATLSYNMLQLINSAQTIKRIRGGRAEIWQNAGSPTTGPTGPAIFGGFMSANLQGCNVQLSSGIFASPAHGTQKPGPRCAIDPPIRIPPPSVAGPDVFVAPPGVTKIMRWGCDTNVVIMDETGRCFVFSPFYKVRELERCVGEEDLPHGTGGAPPGMTLPQRMIEVRIAAKLLFERTPDGLVTHYTYNTWGQLKGYRDPYGREIAFVYGGLGAGDPVYPNLVVAAVDTFGRRAEFTYDSNYTLTSIRPPDLVTGAPGQGLPLARTLEIGMTLHQQGPRQHQRGPSIGGSINKTLMLGLAVERPLDSTAPSFVASFNLYDDIDGGRSRIASVLHGSTENPSWMSGYSAGGTTTYTYSSNHLDLCGTDKTVTVTTPDAAQTTHYFDRWGSETRRDVQNQSGAVVSWLTENIPGVNMVRKRTDPLGVETTYTYQFDADGGWWAGSATLFDMNCIDNRNVIMTETRGAPQGPPLTTVREYGFFGLVKRERGPETPGNQWDVEHTFDYEQSVPSAAGAIVKTEYRAITEGPHSVHAVPTVNRTFNRFAQLLSETQLRSPTDPSGLVTTTSYHPTNDPNGDNTADWGGGLLSGAAYPGSYIKETVVDPTPGLNLVTSHVYNHRGLETRTVDPNGVPTQVLYNEMDQPFATATGAWTVSGSDFNLVSAVDGVSKRLLYYDPNGNAVLKKDYNDNPDTATTTSGYVETRYIYDGIDQLVQTEGMLAIPGSSTVSWVKTFWVRDSMGRVLRQINTDGTAVSATYTYQGQVGIKRYHAEAYTMNGSGEPVDAETPLTSDPKDKVYTLAYANDNTLLSVTDSEGAQATLHYDEYRRRVGRTDPAGSVLMRGLDLKGNVVWEEIKSSANVLLKRTEYAYDESQRPFQKQEKWFDDQWALGDGWVTTKHGFNLAGQVVKQVDDAGTVVEFEFDGAGRQTRLLHPQNLNAPSTQDYDETVYDANGNVIRMKLREYKPDASFVTYELEHVYDDLNRTIQTIQGPGTATPAIMENIYDSLGNTIRTIRPGAVARVGTISKVDTRKRVVQSIDGYNETFSGPIDPNSSGDGFITLTKTYDAYGHLLVEQDDVDVTHATSYEYDNLHRLTKVIYADGPYETVAFRTDDLPDSFKAFDEIGTQLFEIDHQYDGAKRKTAEVYTINPSTVLTGLAGKAWEYDELGRVTDSYALSKHILYPDRDYITHTAYKHDSLGRVLEESQELFLSVSGVPTLLHGHTITSTFDAFGNNIGTASSEGSDPLGFKVDRTFDPNHRLTSVEEVRSVTGPEISATLRWQGATGRIHDIAHWNGTVTTHAQYDGRGRVGEIRTEHGTGGLLAGRSFGYTAASSRTHERKLGETGADYAFEDDVFGRLVNVRKGTWDTGTGGLIGTVTMARRTFDGANSMLLLEEGVEGGSLTQTSAQTDTTNAYTSFGGLSVLRDKRGNTTQIGNEFLVYDVLGHLVGLTDNISAPSNIWYEVWDAEDRRVYRTDFTGDRAFIWDGQTLLQEKNLWTGQVDREYLLGPGTDKVLGQRIAGVPFAFHTDNLSTPYAATDATGAVAERYDIEPFGRMTVTQGTGYSQPLGSKVGLHGGWFDHDTGRIYFRQRVYDPVMARFLSRDPLGFWGAAVNLGNSYCFVANGPTIWRDPSGLNPIILLTSFKPFLGRSTNPSQAVAAAVESNLKSAGASTESLTISVDWKQGQKQLTDKIAEIKKNNPGAKIIVMGIGQWNKGFQLETVARNERGPHRDENGFIPSPGDKNNASDALDEKRHAPGIANDVAKNLGIATSTNAGEFICEGVAYEIYSQVDSGAIESGFFIHVPENPTAADITGFAKRAGDLLGPKGDLDGDGRPNGPVSGLVYGKPVTSRDPNPGKPDPRITP